VEWEWPEELQEEIRNLRRELATLTRRMNDMEASQAQNQAQIDADTAAIAKVGTDLAASVAAVQTELNALQAAQTAGQALDFSSLEAQVASLDSAAQAVSSLVPSPPAPAGS
jgi:predicted  nucleic acid-binding Zn-ribbon protein